MINTVLFNTAKKSLKLLDISGITCVAELFLWTFGALTISYLTKDQTDWTPIIIPVIFMFALPVIVVSIITTYFLLKAKHSFFKLFGIINVAIIYKKPNIFMEKFLG